MIALHVVHAFYLTLWEKKLTLAKTSESLLLKNWELSITVTTCHPDYWDSFTLAIWTFVVTGNT